MKCSTPGLPVHHHLLEFTQTHVHPVSDAIQPSYPLLSPSPPTPNPSQHQSLNTYGFFSFSLFVCVIGETFSWFLHQWELFSTPACLGFSKSTTDSFFLPEDVIPWTEEPGRLPSMGSQTVGHDWATSLHWGCWKAMRLYWSRWFRTAVSYLVNVRTRKAEYSKCSAAWIIIFKASDQV